MEEVVSDTDTDDQENGQDEADEKHEVNQTCNSALRSGLLWLQRDRLFSRWKARHFTLNPDTLCCHRALCVNNRSGEEQSYRAGELLYTIHLDHVDHVDMLDRRGYLTICMALEHSSNKLYLRKPDGIREWFKAIQRRVALSRGTRRPWLSSLSSSTLLTSSSSSNDVEHWLLSRRNLVPRCQGSGSEGRDGLEMDVERKVGSEESSMPRRISRSRLVASRCLASKKSNDEDNDERERSGLLQEEEEEPSRGEARATSRKGIRRISLVHELMRREHQSWGMDRIRRTAAKNDTFNDSTPGRPSNDFLMTAATTSSIMEDNAFSEAKETDDDEVRRHNNKTASSGDSGHHSINTDSHSSGDENSRLAVKSPSLSHRLIVNGRRMLSPNLRPRVSKTEERDLVLFSSDLVTPAEMRMANRQNNRNNTKNKQFQPLSSVRRALVEKSSFSLWQVNLDNNVGIEHV